MEAAGLRVSAYLRQVPLPESRRHELALEVLRELAVAPGVNPEEASARAMTILYALLVKEKITLAAVFGPALNRSHMCPEEMDRRPWVRVFMRVYRPVWLAFAQMTNGVHLSLLQYALLLGGLYALAMDS